MFFSTLSGDNFSCAGQERRKGPFHRPTRIRQTHPHEDKTPLSIGNFRKFLYIWELRDARPSREVTDLENNLSKASTMQTDQKWIVVRIDGKIAAISTDYRQLAAISTQLAKAHHSDSASKSAAGKKKSRKTSDNGVVYGEITATAVTLEDVLKLRQSTRWEDLMLFGTEFQKKVWRKLWELSHDGTEENQQATLLSYSDFAELCNNKAGVRAVAHAIGLNPVSVIIPCHLVVPKDSIDKIREIQRRAESTIFKGEDLCLNSILSDTAIDFGEYTQGKELKRILIMHDLK